MMNPNNWGKFNHHQRLQRSYIVGSLNINPARLWRIAILTFVMLCGLALLGPAAVHAQAIGTWMEADGWGIPTGAVEAADGLFVCRGYYRDGTHIGSLREDEETCLIGWGGREVALTSYEILTDVAGTWVSGTPTMPRGALWGGNHNDGTAHYVCRVSYDGLYHVGKTAQGRCNIGWGREIRFTTFRVFVPNPPPPAIPLDYGDTYYDEVTSASGDRFSFYGTQGEWVEINMGNSDTGTGIHLDTYLELLSPNGTLLASDDDGGEETDSFIYIGSLPATGLYTIIASGYGGDRGHYWLTLD